MPCVVIQVQVHLLMHYRSYHCGAIHLCLIKQRVQEWQQHVTCLKYFTRLVREFFTKCCRVLRLIKGKRKNSTLDINGLTGVNKNDMVHLIRRHFLPGNSFPLKDSFCKTSRNASQNGHIREKNVSPSFHHATIFDFHPPPTSLLPFRSQKG